MDPANIDEALDQLDGLHSLRETHFGFDVAAVFLQRKKNSTVNCWKLLQ